MENRGECTILELERRLYRLGDALTRSQLPAHDVEHFRSLVAAGEPGVALENLCAQLFEHDVPLPLAVYNEIASLGHRMHLDERWWAPLSVKD